MKGNQIIQGDCIEVMSGFPAESVDMVLTSPPYDNLRNYQGYDFNFEAIAKELFRIVKVGGVIVWVVGDATIDGSESGTSFRQALYFKEIGFNLHDTMIYRKLNPMPVKSNRYLPCFEYMFILTKGKPKTFNPILSERKYDDKRKHKNFHRNSDGEFTSNDFQQADKVVIGNVWDIPNRGNDDIAFEHPAIFPEQLAADHIKSWSNEGDLILDPMNGSGTTTKMAKLLKRNYIGIDISETYCEIARKRLESINPML